MFAQLPVLQRLPVAQLPFVPLAPLQVVVAQLPVVQVFVPLPLAHLPPSQVAVQLPVVQLATQLVPSQVLALLPLVQEVAHLALSQDLTAVQLPLLHTAVHVLTSHLPTVVLVHVAA